MRDKSSRTDLRRKSTRIGAAASVGGAIAITLIMALSPTGLGGRTHPTYLAPFTGSTSSAGAYLDDQCGTAAGKTAKWSEKTGVVTGEAKSSVSSCTYVNSFAYGESDEWVSVGLPFVVASNGYYNASEGFTWKVASAMSVSPGACPSAVNQSNGYDYNYCYYDVEWYAEVSSYLYDATNNTVVSNGYNYWQVENSTEVEASNYCNKGSCAKYSYKYTGTSGYNYLEQGPGYDYQAVFGAATASGTGSLWTNSTSWDAHSKTGANTTLIPSHSYELITEFSFVAYSELYGVFDSYLSGVYGSGYFIPSGSASTSVSGLPTNELKLTSATVTRVI